MSKLAAQVEVTKLAHTLGVDAQTLAFLQEMPVEQVQAFHQAASELVFAVDRDVFVRLGKVLSRLPGRFVAWAAEHLIGPEMTARGLTDIPARRAAEIIPKASIPFLADTVPHADPRRLRDVIRLVIQTNPEIVVEGAQELIRRNDVPSYIAAGRFVDFLDDTMLQTVIDAIEDEGRLLRATYYMESRNNLDHVFRMLPEERVQKLIAKVADESQDLLTEYLALVIHVSYGLKRELGDLTAAQDDAVLDRFVRATQEMELWADMLPVVAATSRASQQRMVNLAILREPAVQESIIRAADEQQLWGMVLPFVAMQDDANREAVAGIIAGRTRDTLVDAVDAALLGEYWEPLLDLVRRMPQAKQAEFAEIVRTLGDADPDLVTRIAGQAEKHGLGPVVEGLTRTAAT